MRTKVIDKSKCRGCKNCELACIAIHDEASQATTIYQQGMTEAPRARNKVEIDRNKQRFPQFCRHCEKPACIEACMSGALQKNADGYVICDSEICIGCYMCVMSCPYGMARPAIGNTKKMSKCDGCYDKDCMACVAACPSGCLSVIENGEKAVVFVKAEQNSSRNR